MARDADDATPISSRRELVERLEAGVKDPGQLRVGTEHEKIPFLQGDARPGRLRESRRSRADRGSRGFAWLVGDPGRGPSDRPLRSRRRGAISIEPGGQFELSGAPLASLHETKRELDAHFDAVAAVAGPLGISFLDLGASPKWSRAETPVMPKQRYKIMSEYMPKVGALGLDMMFRTATIQANLDFTSEADMVKKFRAGLALQPVVTALFANSPFLDGKPTGALSQRSAIWRDTDAARTGMLPFVFEDGMGFERYVDYALDVPMYFVKRGGVYHDVAGASFRDLLAGRLPQLPGERATASDWANHLSTIFPEVRLKTYMEMRGADGGPKAHILALPALFVGLFYDFAALDAALDIVSDWTAQEREALRAAVPFRALETRIKCANLAGGRARRDGLGERGIAAAGAQRRGRRRREPISRAARGDRAKRQAARGGEARRLQRTMEEERRSGLRGMRAALKAAARWARAEI